MANPRRFPPRPYARQMERFDRELRPTANWVNWEQGQTAQVRDRGRRGDAIQ